MQRDVPGMTRAAIPLMADAGVKALSQGVNTASAPPGIPKNTPIIWQDPESSTSVLLWVHAGNPIELSASTTPSCKYIHTLGSTDQAGYTSN